MSMLWPYLQRYLPHHKVHLHSYGFMGFWEARWDNKKQAKRLAAVVNEGDIIINHSNGAAITYLACRHYGARPDGVININPALDRRRTHDAKWVRTIHSDSDRWVWLSRWLPGHIWGDQGKVGYRGKSRYTTNCNASRLEGVLKYDHHCGLFHHCRIDEWAQMLSQWIVEKTQEKNQEENA